jgi:hypothetical protein
LLAVPAAREALKLRSNDVLFSRWYHPPFRWFSEDAASLDGTIWRLENKPPKIGMFHEKVGVVL